MLCCAVTACDGTLRTQSSFHSSLAGCYVVCIVLCQVAVCLMCTILLAGKEVSKQRLVSMHYVRRC